MPLAPVDNSDTQLYYEDTGAPPGSSDYRTLIIVHGGGFNGSTFRPMFVHATDHNMRIVAVNMRDYRGSTPFSSSDLEQLGSMELDKQRSMIQARGSEIAAFLLWFVRKEDVPHRLHKPDDGRSGGVALLAWSWGNSMTMSFLAQAKSLPEEDRRLLGDNLTAFIIYDSSRYGLGVPPALFEGVRRPELRSGSSMDQKQVHLHWLSGYFSHSSSPLDSLCSATLDELRAGLAQSPILDPPVDYQPTAVRMTPQELEEVTDPAVNTRAHPLFHAVDPGIYRNNMQAALWDSTTWPHLKVTLVWCDMSPPETIISAWYITQQIKEEWPKDARKVDVLRFEGANHFTRLYYEDIGVPPGLPNYQTLVLVHGGIFNSGVYKRLFAHAAEHSIRLVTLNMRDYRLSTPYSPSELTALGSGDPQQQRSMIQARGLEIATFLLWFIRKESVPPPSSTADYGSTRGGGLAVLGWSWGNAMTISFFAQATELPESDRRLLDAYLRGFVIYDCSRHGPGVPREVTEGLYSPTRDPNIPVEERVAAFGHWVSGYYAHSPDVLAAFPSLTLDEIRKGIAQRPLENPPSYHIASVVNMSAEVLSEMTDPEVVRCSHLLYNNVDPAVYKGNLDATLLDASTWPRVRVSLVWCDMSPPETLVSTWYLAKEVQERWPQGARKITLVRFEGANHFAHWDQPERTMKLLAELI
ncbi:hypothetical protein DAEQUDRAFT_697601 [Daedalea quercina L-15889]|uniref:AB hydrolase-1 domain-containing protein n=1 Tax=Daedalea quercina L-15889 TaxID=1314783 RepID=A0A165M1R3_9APHY|nr:hypothetical protein DAEQUDRAFT_697601 [Daedalea quercina L-15889]